MITPNDVPASRLIEKIAKYLKENVDAVTPPQWAFAVKTGAQAEKHPQNQDWWYVRCASIFRKVYVHGPIGIEKMRAEYGGVSGFRVRPEHAVKAGGSIIRKAFQQLQNAGYVEIAKTRGRRLTKDGRKVLQDLAEEINGEMAKQNPELAKYQKGE